MSSTRTTSRSPSANIWPISIVTFFSIALLGLGGFVWFCSHHPADLVARDYYEQELRYEGQIERLRNAQTGVAAAVSYEAATRRIVISVPGAVHASGQIQLYRPSAANLDRRLKFEPDATGVQRIDAADLRPGLWKVRVSWRAEGREFLVDQKVVVASPAS